MKTIFACLVLMALSLAGQSATYVINPQECGLSIDNCILKADSPGPAWWLWTTTGWSLFSNSPGSSVANDIVREPDATLNCGSQSRSKATANPFVYGPLGSSELTIVTVFCSGVDPGGSPVTLSYYFDAFRYWHSGDRKGGGAAGWRWWVLAGKIEVSR